MLARSLSRMAVLSRRGFAAAAAQQHQQKNPEELRLTFASPDTVCIIGSDSCCGHFLKVEMLFKAFFNNAVVKQVDVPTLAGMVGVLANHVPTIGVLKPGVVSVTDMEGQVTKLFVSSGTMSMNIDGTCQVLAEEVVRIEDIDQTVRLRFHCAMLGAVPMRGLEAFCFELLTFQAARNELEAAQRAAVDGSDLAKAEAQIRAEVGILRSSVSST
ncbi:unnamed protein product [Heligmosomoides polygyrus]|uniref:ATP-synt_DE_N domain-containing protein n=1 Tax=Heligmosomoides polygyrus TaxID=6339 RepID=A0A183FUN5_HELPZ|nr:unnamed protein product [Heligmosomoides polygyrus]